MDFDMPPCRTNAAGEERRVGFEFEMTGLSTEKMARIVADLFGGRVEIEDRFHARVTGTPWGKFSVEVDAQILQDQKYLGYLKKLGLDISNSETLERLEKALERVANLVVPYEISTPPLPLSCLGELERLRAALQARHAEGTKANVLYAFGMHLNPEMPARNIGTALIFLQSFLVCAPWLMQEMKVDFTRRLAPFIRPFPDDYVEQVLALDYGEEKRVIPDYLKHNPTRNRPLDMLPIFALWDEKAVKAAIPEDEEVRARPAFHYRLPDCRLDEPEWRVAADWNRWVRVETLAANPAKLRELRAEFLAEKEKSVLWQSRWGDRIREKLR
jgi:hypothetical protein